ncbi:hypothetical protein D910_06132 [Dendroctonus ponderosae]
MGCTVSAEERAAIARTKQIDQKLRLEASKKHKDIKLLLLDAADRLNGHFRWYAQECQRFPETDT